MVDATAKRPREPSPGRAFAQLEALARTDEQRALIAAATRLANRTWIGLHNGQLGPAADVIPPRGPAWYRAALWFHEVLHRDGAYGHLAQVQTHACACAEPVVAAWLTSPTTPGHDAATAGSGWAAVSVGEQLGVGDAFSVVNDDTQLAHLSGLLDAAQDAQVFGVPGHRVELASTTGHHDACTLVRVVVDPPHGPCLSSRPIPLTELADPDRVGVGGATAALVRVAEVVTDLFLAHAHAVWVAPPPRPDTNGALVSTGRAFPDLRLDQPAASLTPPTRGPGPAAPQPDSPDPNRSRPR